MSAQIKDGGPAFPIKGYCADASGALSGEVIINAGMTLRHYFAAKALPAMLQDYHDGLRNGEYVCDPDWAIGVAVDAYRLADAMLRASEVQS